jgi:hypothetical protein
MLVGVVFLTPRAALVALALLLPVAAFVIAERRVATVRRVLALRPPRSGTDLVALASLVAVVALLALAAAQPALSETRTQHVRTDAEALYIVDVSQSMAASSSRRGKQRLERAISDAIRLRASVPAIPSGVATLTDRVLPNLLPVPDVAAFDATMRQTIQLDQPPPREQSVRATSFSALAAIPGSGYFSPSAKHRTVVLLTDGESSPFDASAVARALGGSEPTKLLTVQLWRRDESIYEPSGRTDPNYRPDPASKTQLASLASAAHGRAFTEGQLGQAASELRASLGTGPTRAEGRTQATHPLAPYLALLALVPLALIFVRNLRLRRQ